MNLRLAPSDGTGAARPVAPSRAFAPVAAMSLPLFAAACVSTPRPSTPLPVTPPPDALSGPGAPPPADALSLSALPGWAEEDHLAALTAYAAGCAPSRISVQTCQQ